MALNPPADTPRITPYLFYEDAGAAVAWLERCFGFRERDAERIEGPDGRVMHSAMDLDDGVIMLGSPSDYQCPKRHGRVNQLLYVYVDDVDLHCQRSLSEGAVILADPEETFYGDRRYTAEDLEGHHWTFAQRMRDVPPEEWSPTARDLDGHG